jgi:hypothetical protein
MLLAAGSHGLTTISATNPFHTRTANARCAQQTQKPRGNVRLAYAGVRPGNEETHATADVASASSGLLLVTRKMPVL